MEKHQFSIAINAPREKVWNVLWDNDSYQQWTSVFSEGSRVETDWKKGSKALFLNADRDGMLAIIDENIPNEFMSFRHVGEVKKGVEENASQDWVNSHENYRLTDNNGKTTLLVEMDITAEWKEYFDKTFPQALAKVKELAEA
ncbi:SRPBCC family protein [Chitinophaga solisilvae]|uniref:SRPBCC domain-containing protein n=1 Tax=Chitinophaga solisilvae TaxID=1233460 RepID=A0A433WB92_9BACT|nr:SRPBCC domain-containing protein [Chitinophaga solisilvae]NSL86379.1 SRPBCC domain-containing protein [Chitinophaga solisilvae]